MVHTEPVSRQRVPSPVTVARFLPSATGPVWTGEWVRRPSTAAADGAKQLTVTGWSAVGARLFKINIVYFLATGCGDGLHSRYCLSIVSCNINVFCTGILKQITRITWTFAWLKRAELYKARNWQGKCCNTDWLCGLWNTFILSETVICECLEDKSYLACLFTMLGC